jgi:hypothetical protein
LFVVAGAALAIASVACSGGMVAVGKSEQQLQKQTNGQPTGNGSTCSWEGTALYDGASGKPGAEASNVGDTFKSLDGCNDCSCSASGIMCTVRTCSSPPSNGTDAGEPKCATLARECACGGFASIGPNCELICPDVDESSCPPVDESKLGPVCTSDDKWACPAGQTCTEFPGVVGYRCASDACAAVTCPSGQCIIKESFPPRVRCGN